MSEEGRLAVSRVPSLLSHYQDNEINPVPIALDDQAAWSSHFAKRRNLYERHLGIPLSLLRGRSVLEFGCNSGENALVLASVGADLTLVEPNEQVLPRLHARFRQFGLEERIVELVQEDIDSFESESQYDVVLAEGFLGTLPNRVKLVQKLCDFLAPGGLGVISFNDRYGGLLEMVRKLVLRRACELGGIDDFRSHESLELARRLYGRDYAEISTSRPFEAWWADDLVTQFTAWVYLWSYQELVPLIENAGCEFYSSSPQWARLDHFEWYKNVDGREERHERLLDEWAGMLPYFLTGLDHVGRGHDRIRGEIAGREVLGAVATLVARSSDYVHERNGAAQLVSYPDVLRRYLDGLGDPVLARLNEELGMLYKAMASEGLDELVSAYTETQYLGSTWGTHYHYLCFIRRPDTAR